MDVKRALAGWLRWRADRLDPDGAPRPAPWSYTEEDGWGAVFHTDGRGCPLYYFSPDKGRAHAEARQVPRDLDEIEFITAGFKDAGMVTVYGSAEVTNAKLSRRIVGYDEVKVPNTRRSASVPRNRVTLTCELGSFVILQGRTYRQAVEEMFRRDGVR